ncbi:MULTISPECIES: D-alanyl-D-alanine carboxypeptidase/D-alanyl-D-alanine-endopeptidase [Streptomyces]|uniref:D-alanyl-D-alanine carboxypeptidase/D-alanyl-D-alanine-endopeptidase n=1 Tax=Streptomyces koelreuteriae TaxID=2838015 RepID=A0ABX8FSH4_9ACTN|nr:MULTISPECIES: D-alanyl-D-alanine carboxypeptidase/D-alanyl-D-alanine-endopeptidase [Streptomyces]QWB23967.1 D-alanyl-D-alanine carboxypeptidase/D-alanyl-D-alanine-endopeptidase [Streptomyces koelreuteriae]UUA06949.1 D-alanyl-D-alanine carboxypeptidase/D-alanyl-D-alanine-endopeptidase [Streptomyces koelreuteriae]UUA14578.1 D-alanyl-D-alanine carboxypeptidase/D-alanyl-D-alanine-endopeptidase [Streptomyces sp. CRCS-T-1]
MFVPELRPWRSARPHVVRIAGAVRPRLARAAAAAKPRVARLARAGKPQVARLMRPKTWQYTAGAATAGLALAAGVVTAAGPWDSSGQRTAERDRAAALNRPGGTDHGGTSGAPGRPRPAPSAAPVLRGLGGVSKVKSAPDGRALSSALTPLLEDPALGPRPAAAVVDVTSGRRLYGTGSDAALTPASTTKIATAVAALSAMGADHRITTRAALEPDTREVVLVGGGDPTLTAHEDAAGAASLRDLAADTAGSLAERGIREVTLSYDTTLYAGDEKHPIGVNPNLALISPLMADEARTDDSTKGPVARVPDPAQDAADRFGDLLKSHGIKTTAPGPSKATTRAKTLATVSSPPLSALVERMLTNSDNDIAEALARQTALATGERADFEGADRAVGTQLRKLGLPLKGAAFKDGSGLNRADRLTADLLTALLAKAADPGHPELRPALTGLPVAGFTGTLTSRYTDGAAGVVRAKTGTLTGVNTLAGTLVDQDGRLLAFAFMANETTNPEAAQKALDRAATTLSECGCR